jgi:hypothetical protein
MIKPRTKNPKNHISGVFHELLELELFASIELFTLVRFLTEFVGRATKLFICLTVLFISISSYYKISRFDSL